MLHTSDPASVAIRDLQRTGYPEGLAVAAANGIAVHAPEDIRRLTLAESRFARSLRAGGVER